ncbi:arsenate reductase/protein-tyrosine-phosphatase family protein [Lentzea californiensis]|uniref:arsenate reductase/protein-tyrosine-phosphatase family protein n=1 Tax=Lentzea californiensis TaxID=438851 RepID=UPI002165890C|nr:ArsR family transcriptional regulator [Lentzea californiensis]MCR3750670.1 Protein-tyrosine-phosphatase [Lentzea californiensis]
MTTDRRTAGAPPFLRLAGEPLRWDLLRELARSDQRVGDLVTAVGQPQNLVSYHLRKLRSGGLVTGRRSSADGRDTYYRLDLGRCAELLAGTGKGLHPALELLPPPPPPEGAVRGRVLFLCTGNSARSQMAEALLRRRAPQVEVMSAGSHPKPLHPNAVAVMREYGIDLSGHRGKHLGEFAGQRFDHVISLCDKVREVCPEFPGHPGPVHWSMPDPSAAGDTPEACHAAFSRAAEELSTRIGFLLQNLAHSQETRS